MATISPDLTDLFSKPILVITAMPFSEFLVFIFYIFSALQVNIKRGTISSSALLEETLYGISIPVL
jgi:hypothetical protein